MFDIDLQSRIPIYEQLYRKIVELAVDGSIKENEQLPSVRALAKELGVNPNTVSKTYQALERDKVIYSLPGRGSFVGAIKQANIHTELLEKFDEIAESALKSGIAPATLREHIDQTEKRLSL